MNVYEHDFTLYINFIHAYSYLPTLYGYVTTGAAFGSIIHLSIFNRMEYRLRKRSRVDWLDSMTDPNFQIALAVNKNLVVHNFKGNKLLYDIKTIIEA